MTSTLRVSNAKAKADLGWQPTVPTYRDGIARIANTLTAPSPQPHDRPPPQGSSNAHATPEPRGETNPMSHVSTAQARAGEHEDGTAVAVPARVLTITRSDSGGPEESSLGRAASGSGVEVSAMRHRVAGDDLQGMGEAMAEIELSAGSILYEDTGGEGPVLVLLHGLLMTASLWDEVVEELGPGFRCVRPTLPLGAHRRPMRPEADLSLRGQVRLLVEFLERLELQEVTLVFNDWCGAQLLVAEGWDARVGRLVLASCETYDNYPPGLPGRVAALAARLPGGLAAALKPLRFKALRRLPMTFGLMSKRPVPDELIDQWLEPALTNPAIRGDLRKYAGDTREGRRQLVRANSRLSGFGKPVLVAWAAEDKVMPIQAGRQLAESFPHARFVEILDSRTLIPIDQARALAGVIAAFVGDPKRHWPGRLGG
jgi:pimeloyl-ACP methyl ester carboxylesterase